MAGKTSILSVRIVGDGKPLKRALDRSSSQVDSFAKKVSRVTSAASSMAGVASKIALIGTAVAGAVSSIGTLTIAVAGAGKLIGALAGASLALPGIMAGMAVGAGTLYLALMDLPKVLGDLAPMFGELQAAISARFWSAAADPIRELVTALLPSLQDGLVKVAGALGRWTADLAHAVQTVTSSNGLAVFFDNVTYSIDIARSAIGPFIAGLAAILAAGSAYLPPLALWFAGLSTTFGAWAQRVTADGSLQGWVSRGIESLRLLGSWLGSVGDIIGAVAQAASAVSPLGLEGLAAGTRALADALATPTVQQWMTAGFSLASQTVQTAVGALVALLGALSPLIAPLAQVWGSALQLATALVGALAPALSGLAQTIAPAVEAVAGLISQFAAQLESNESLRASLVTLGEAIGTAVAGAVRVLVPIVSALIPIFAQILTFVGNNAEAFISLGVAVMAGVAAWRAMSAATTAYSAVAGVVRGVMTGVTTAMAAYRAGLTLKTAALAGASAAQRALNLTMKANPIGIVVTALAALVAGLVWFFTQTKAGQAAWAAFTSFMQTAIQAAGAGVQIALQVMSNLWNSIVNGLRVGWQVFTTALGVAVNVAFALIRGYLNVFFTVWRTVFTGLLTLARSIFTGIGAAFRVLSALWTSLVSGMRERFSSGFNAVRTTANVVLNAVKGFFNRPVEGARRVFDMLGKLPGPFQHLRGVAQAVTGAISSGLDRVAGLASKVKDALGGAINGVKNLLGIGGTGFSISPDLGQAFSLSLSQVAGSNVGATALGFAPSDLVLGESARRTRRADPEREGGTSLGGVTYNIVNNNPIAETPSETLRKNNRMLSIAGL